MNSTSHCNFFSSASDSHTWRPRFKHGEKKTFNWISSRMAPILMLPEYLITYAQTSSEVLVTHCCLHPPIAAAHKRTLIILNYFNSSIRRTAWVVAALFHIFSLVHVHPPAVVTYINSFWGFYLSDKWHTRGKTNMTWICRRGIWFQQERL